MKINKGFELREMCGEHIIIGTGVENIDFSKVISLNESAAWLWREVEGKEFTAETLASLLVGRYVVSEATALADVAKLLDEWVNLGIVSEP
jgi:hypothetical protein